MSAATIDPPSYDVEIRGTALPEPDHEYVFAGRLGERYDTDMRSFDRADVGAYERQSSRRRSS